MMASDNEDSRIEALQSAIVKRATLLAVLFLLNGIMVAIAVVGLNMAQNKFRNNPLFDYQTQYQAHLTASRDLISDYSEKVSHFKSNAKITTLAKREDPSQLLIKDMIYLERDYQDFIIYMLIGMKDLSRLVGGVDEWYYFQSREFNSFISNSRKRQKILRGLLKKKQRPLSLSDDKVQLE